MGVAMGWSNSEMQLLIINVRDNQNNRWKWKARQKKKTERCKGVAQVIVKVWKLNGFVARVVQLICKSNSELALSIIIQLKVCYGGV